MVTWYQVAGVRTAALAGLRAAAIFNRLPPTVRTLSPTAIICHFLPRTDRCLSPARMSECRGKNQVCRVRDSMSRTGLKLWPVDFPMGAGWRSLARDLFLENEVEGLRGPVTVCHVNSGDSRRGDSSRETDGDGVEEETCGRRFRRGRRPAPNGGEDGRRPALNKETSRLFDGSKTTSWRQEPIERRHWAAAGDRIWGFKGGLAAMVRQVGRGECFNVIHRKINLSGDL